jgi:hypothetical protein
MNFPNEIDIILTYKNDPEHSEILTEKVGAVKHGDFYRLIHVPAFAPNLAVGDIVRVEFDDGEFHFDKLIEESGNSTIHIILFKPDSKDRVIRILTRFRCVVNSHVADNYLVINIPPDVYYQPVRDYLLSEKLDENIDFKEACLSRLHVSNQN